MLPVNTLAPDFEAPDQDGVMRTLAQYRGRWVILYFYPKDDTPGCTKEACNFRDSYRELERLGAQIIGVSRDTVSSHRKFADKYGLNFPILADPERKVILSYDVWGKKKFLGREFEGVKRETYLIDPEGKIMKGYESVNPVNHASEIRKDVERLMKK